MKQKTKLAKKINKADKYIAKLTEKENDRSHTLPVSEIQGRLSLMQERYYKEFMEQTQTTYIRKFYTLDEVDHTLVRHKLAKSVT